MNRLSLLTLFVASGCILATSASAISCKQGSQLVNGQWLETPYCQDQLLAQVGREHGFNSTAEHIRSNPNYKKEVCRFVFSDIRVQENCATAGVPEGFGAVSH